MVNRTINGEGYMMPLGGPEFWLQAELQDAMDRCAADVPAHVINLTLLPLSPEDIVHIDRVLDELGRLKIG